MLPAADDEPDLTPIDPADLDADYYRLVLRQLTDIGMTFAHALGYEASAQAVATACGETDSRDRTLAELAVAYDRVARAVRRTVALAHRINAQAPAARTARTTARKRIIRAVEDAIDRQREATPPGADDPCDDPGYDDTRHEDLHAEFAERLDDPALDDDILTRPVPEIIADICRDLGLAAPADPPGGNRRTPDDIRALCARAAQPRGAKTPRPAIHHRPSPAAPPPHRLAAAPAATAHTPLRTAPLPDG